MRRHFLTSLQAALAAASLALPFVACAAVSATNTSALADPQQKAVFDELVAAIRSWCKGQEKPFLDLISKYSVAQLNGATSVYGPDIDPNEHDDNITNVPALQWVILKVLIDPDEAIPQEELEPVNKKLLLAWLRKTVKEKQGLNDIVQNGDDYVTVLCYAAQLDQEALVREMIEAGASLEPPPGCVSVIETIADSDTDSEEAQAYFPHHALRALTDPQYNTDISTLYRECIGKALEKAVMNNPPLALPYILRVVDRNNMHKEVAEVWVSEPESKEGIKEAGSLFLLHGYRLAQQTPLLVEMMRLIGPVEIVIITNEELEALLKSMGINAQDADGFTALATLAAVEGYSHSVVASTLIELGADVDLVDFEGNTPLMHAARTGKADIVEELLNAKANCLARNIDGKTALDLAVTDEIKAVLTEATKAATEAGK